jgi:hypothetical protein
MSFVSIAAGVTAGSALFKVGKGINQNRLANEVEVPDANYTTSPYAQSMLDEAKRIRNAAMPGSAEAARGIYGAQGNAMDAIGRNATSGVQALALLAATQGNTAQAFNNQRLQEGQYDAQTLANLNNADQGMINEGDKIYQAALQRRQEAIAEKNALRGASTQNIGGGVNDLQNAAFLLATSGVGNKQPNNPYIPPLSRDVVPPEFAGRSMASSTGYINPNITINRY